MTNQKGNVVVTGGAGFIGSNLVRHLLATGDDEVTVLDALTYAGNRASLDSVADRIEFVHGDIADLDLVDNLVSGVDAVVHFAAETHVDRSILDAAVFLRTNVVGTQVLLDAALLAAAVQAGVGVGRRVGGEKGVAQPATGTCHLLDGFEHGAGVEDVDQSGEAQKRQAPEACAGIGGDGLPGGESEDRDDQQQAPGKEGVRFSHVVFPP